MNNTFQINKVYSNSELRCYRGSHVESGNKFYRDLYKDRPQDCPWPKAMKLYAEHIERYKECENYIIPIKRTKCYVTFENGFRYTQKCRIRIDENNNEFIKVDDIIVSVNDIQDSDSLTAREENRIETEERRLNLEYIKALEHLEEYGYVYRRHFNMEIRVTTIEELNQIYGK